MVVKITTDLNKLLGIALIACLMSSCYKDYDNSSESELDPTPPIIIGAGITGFIPSGTNPHEDLLLHVNDNTYQIDGNYFNLELDNIKKLGQSFFISSNNHIVAAAYSALVENDNNFIKFTDLQNVLTINEDDVFNKSFTIKEGIQISVQNQVDHSYSINWQEEVDQSVLQFAYGPADQLIKPLTPTVFYLNFQSNSISDPLNDDIQMTFDSQYIGQSVFLLSPGEDRWKHIKTLLTDDLVLKTKSGGIWAVSHYENAQVLNGTVQNSLSKKISYANLVQNSAKTNSSFNATINGNWLCIVSQLSDNQINIITPCEDPIYTENVQIEMSDINLDIIITDELNVLNFNGSLYDCQKSKVNDAVIHLIDVNPDISNYPIHSDFDMNILTCNQSYKFDIKSTNSNTSGPSIAWSSKFVLEQYPLCSEIENDFSFLQVREDKMLYSDILILDDGNSIILRNTDDFFRISFEDSLNSELSGEDINIYINDQNFGSNGYFISCEESNVGCGISEASIDIINYKDEQWKKFEFKGELWMQTISPAQAGYFNTSGFLLCKID